ncbi:MAG: SDR family oxidoreductase [Pirellulales bacterium]
MRVSGHKVLVTGGSAGIGFALARELRDRDNQVMICGRSAERLAEAARQIPGVYTEPCDIADDGDLKRLVDTAVAKLGGLTLLVNNAGIQFNHDFSRVDLETLLRDTDLEIDVNLTALVKLTVLCLPLLRQQDPSAVVNVSSGLALVPKPSAPVYCATKAGVHMFSKSLRWQLEESASSVRVFEVLPPMVDTAMTRGRGKGKLSPKQVADEVVRGIERDRREIRVGAVKMLAWVNRFQPWLAERILRRT